MYVYIYMYVYIHIYIYTLAADNRMSVCRRASRCSGGVRQNRRIYSKPVSSPDFTVKRPSNDSSCSLFARKRRRLRVAEGCGGC